MSEMHYMKLSDDFEKELREKGNTVTESQHVAILTFAIWLEKYVAEQSVHPTALCAGHSGGSIAKEGICQECGLPSPRIG